MVRGGAVLALVVVEKVLGVEEWGVEESGLELVGGLLFQER
jgi:hypothetical protein